MKDTAKVTQAMVMHPTLGVRPIISAINPILSSNTRGSNIGTIRVTTSISTVPRPDSMAEVARAFTVAARRMAAADLTEQVVEEVDIAKPCLG
jgi:hypothetical protein